MTYSPYVSDRSKNTSPMTTSSSISSNTDRSDRQSVDSCDVYVDVGGSSSVESNDSDNDDGPNDQIKPLLQKSLFKGPKEMKMVGLSNLGNTCYMNSAIQCLLLNCPPLVNYFTNCGKLARMRTVLHRQLRSAELASKKSANQNSNASQYGYLFGARPQQSHQPNVVVAVLDLFLSVSVSQGVVTPSRLVQDLRIARSYAGAQQDTMDFIRACMQYLHDDLSSFLPIKETAVKNADESEEESSDTEDAQKSIAPVVTHRLSFAAAAATPPLVLKVKGRPKPSFRGYKPDPTDSSIVSDSFRGVFSNTVECNQCGYQSIHEDPFYELILSIPNIPTPSSTTSSPIEDGLRSIFGLNRTPSPAPSESGVNLQSCLQNMCAGETLTGENAWKCKRCKQSVTARKTMCIAKCPPVLIIQLKRFKQVSGKGEDSGKFWNMFTGGSSAGSFAKINTHVNFPIQGLEMTPYMLNHKDSSIYDLTGIIVHMGSLSGGHYIAYCKGGNGGWYEANDSMMRAISNPEQIVTKQQAYVLFYSRRRSSIMEPICSVKDDKSYYVNKEWFCRWQSLTTEHPGYLVAKKDEVTREAVNIEEHHDDIICPHGLYNPWVYAGLRSPNQNISDEQILELMNENLLQRVPASIVRKYAKRDGDVHECAKASVALSKLPDSLQCPKCISALQSVEQRRTDEFAHLLRLSDQTMQEGRKWPYYAISKTWLDSWDAWIKPIGDSYQDSLDGSLKVNPVNPNTILPPSVKAGSIPPMHPIDNSRLVKQRRQASSDDSMTSEQPLKKGMREGIHYRAIPEPMWRALQEKYGGGPEIRLEENP